MLGGVEVGMLAKTYTFVLGTGNGEDKLDSFDSALIDAGVGNLNLIKVSSILPPGCTYCTTPKWVEGQTVYCVYTSIISNAKGEIISAAIGVAKPKERNLPGVIMKYSASGYRKTSEKVVKEMCIRAMTRRSIEDYEVMVQSKEYIVEKDYCCVFTGVILNDNCNIANKLMVSDVNWRCLGAECPNNCCGPFVGLHTTLKPIANIRHSEIILLPEDVERLVEISRKDLIKKQNTNYFIKTKEDGTCFALSEGSCTIYPARPTLCRAYPFYIDLFTGLSMHVTCPGIGKGITPLNEIEPYLEAVKTVYNYWLSRMD